MTQAMYSFQVMLGLFSESPMAMFSQKEISIITRNSIQKL